jgi:hypothetical protein
VTKRVRNIEAAARVSVSDDRSAKDNELLALNCGRCGKPFVVRIADLGNPRLVDCDACRGGAWTVGPTHKERNSTRPASD